MYTYIFPKKYNVQPYTCQQKRIITTKLICMIVSYNTSRGGWGRGRGRGGGERGREEGGEEKNKMMLFGD
jgi:hypothetical protein